MEYCPSCDYGVSHGTPNYCPDCGEEWEEEEIDYPFEIDHYVHEQVTVYDIEDNWGITEDEHPELYDRLRYVGYEEKLTYRVTSDSIDVVKVNGRTVDGGDN